MIRPFTILCFCAFAGAGAWLYHVKHSVALQDAELRQIWREIEQDRDRTSILRAEWALLNEPDRLRQVVTRHLTLEPMQPQQFARLAEMERRLPAAVAFAGAPNLFVPQGPAGASPDGAVMLASVQDVPGPRADEAALDPTGEVNGLAPPPPPAPPLTAFAQPGPEAPNRAPASPARAYAQLHSPAQPAEDPRAAETPAPQVLAAAVAVQRASRVAPRPVERPAEREVRPAVHYAPAPSPASRLRSTEASPMVRTAANPPPVAMARAAPVAPAPVFVSALGGATSLGIGRPTMAPPVPFSAAQAATLERQGNLAAPRIR